MGDRLCSHTAPSQACRDFLALAETHSRKWQRALQYEQEQRVHLEETIEQLAKQHNSLERAFRNSLPGRAPDPSKSFNQGERWNRPSRAHTGLALANSGRPPLALCPVPAIIWQQSPCVEVPILKRQVQ